MPSSSCLLASCCSSEDDSYPYSPHCASPLRQVPVLQRGTVCPPSLPSPPSPALRAPAAFSASPPLAPWNALGLMERAPAQMERPLGRLERASAHLERPLGASGTEPLALSGTRPWRLGTPPWGIWNRASGSIWNCAQAHLERPPGAYSPAISAARSLRALHSARVIPLLRSIWGSSLGTKSNTCPRSQ